MATLPVKTGGGVGVIGGSKLGIGGSAGIDLGAGVRTGSGTG